MVWRGGKAWQASFDDPHGKTELLSTFSKHCHVRKSTPPHHILFTRHHHIFLLVVFFSRLAEEKYVEDKQSR